jgi:hypothetical protein
MVCPGASVISRRRGFARIDFSAGCSRNVLQKQWTMNLVADSDLGQEWLLKFLADYQSAEGTPLGRLLTAGKLADIRELERMFALECEGMENSSRK